MMVAFELHKTVDELEHLTLDEIADWLAFFKVRQKRMEQEARQNRGKG